MKVRTYWFLILFIPFVLLVGCSDGAEEGYSTLVEDESQLPTEGEYLMYFHSDECPYCKEFEPTLKEYKDEKGALDIYKFNASVDESSSAGGSAIDKYDLEIQGTPALVHMNGEEVLDTLIGVQDLKNIPVAE